MAFYDSDGREYTRFVPLSEPVPEVSSTGLNEPAAAESTDPASEPAQEKKDSPS